MQLYKTITITITMAATIAIFFGTWIGICSLIGYIANNITNTKPIILSNSAKTKLQKLQKDHDNRIQHISTPKHKPSSTICSPGSKKKGNRK